MDQKEQEYLWIIKEFSTFMIIILIKINYQIIIKLSIKFFNKIYKHKNKNKN